MKSLSEVRLKFDKNGGADDKDGGGDGGLDGGDDINHESLISVVGCKRAGCCCLITMIVAMVVVMMMLIKMVMITLLMNLMIKIIKFHESLISVVDCKRAGRC